MTLRFRLAVLPLVLAAATARGDDPNSSGRTLTGNDALGDWTTDAPGVRRKVTVDDLAALDAHRASPHFSLYVTGGLLGLLESRTPELYEPLDA